MSTELIAIIVLAGIVGPLQILLLGLLWNLTGQMGKVEGLLEGLLLNKNRPDSSNA